LSLSFLDQNSYDIVTISIRHVQSDHYDRLTDLIGSFLTVFQIRSSF